MIVTILGNSNPSDYEGTAHKEDILAILRPVGDCPAVSFNLCDYQCPYEELAFSESGAITESHKNDKSQFLFKLADPGDTVTIKIFKCENEIFVEKAILNDNTYGTFFNSSSFPNQDLNGYDLDWNAVYNAFGGGKYYIQADRTIIGAVDTLRSWTYNLRLFDEIEADNTLVINSTNSGKIEGGVDYTGFNWQNSIRIRGNFGKPNYSIEKDHYIKQNREDRQIRDSIETIYTLETELVPQPVIEAIIKTQFLGNNIWIRPYELQGFLSPYCNYYITPEDLGDPTYFARNTNGAFAFNLSNVSKTPVKTN